MDKQPAYMHTKPFIISKDFDTELKCNLCRWHISEYFMNAFYDHFSSSSSMVVPFDIGQWLSYGKEELFVWINLQRFQHMVLCIAWQAEYFLTSNIGDIECIFNIRNFEFNKLKETIER